MKRALAITDLVDEYQNGAQRELFKLHPEIKDVYRTRGESAKEAVKAPVRASGAPQITLTPR